MTMAMEQRKASAITEFLIRQSTAIPQAEYPDLTVELPPNRGYGVF